MALAEGGGAVVGIGIVVVVRGELVDAGGATQETTRRAMSVMAPWRSWLSSVGVF